MKKRLQVVLSHAGISSRRKAENIIESGRVAVNGIIVREKGKAVDTEIDRIEVDGKLLSLEDKIYIVLNKPKDVVTTSSDEKGRKTVLDLVHERNLRIYPVGRLDKDTEGVLLFTNDGDLAYRLTHPRFEIKKIYVAHVKGSIDKEDIKKLEKGIYLDGEKTSPSQIHILKKSSNKSVFRIEIHEGRKRQIRKMFEAIGGEVTRLTRVEYAGITAKGLQEGEYRYLTENEIKILRKAGE